MALSRHRKHHKSGVVRSTKKEGYFEPILPSIGCSGHPTGKSCRRCNRRDVMLYEPLVIGAQLSKKHPFIKMRSGGVYGVQTRINPKTKLEEPIGTFVRVDYDHTPVKMRKKERRALRKIQAAMKEIEKEQGNEQKPIDPIISKDR